MYFRGVTRVDKVLESRNFGKPPPRCMQPNDKKSELKKSDMKVELMKKIILSIGLSFSIFCIFGQQGCKEILMDYSIPENSRVIFSDTVETSATVVIREDGLDLLYRNETNFFFFERYFVKSRRETVYCPWTMGEGSSSYTLTFFEKYEEVFTCSKNADLFKPEGAHSLPYFLTKHIGCCEYTDYYELSTFPKDEKFLSYNKCRFEIHASGYDRSRSKENFIIYFGYDMCSYYQDTNKIVLGTLNYSINQKINGSVVFKRKNPTDKVGFPGFAPSKVQLMENGEPVGEPTSYYRENTIAINSENLNYLQDVSEINNLGIIVTFMFYGEGKDRQSYEKDYKIEFVNGKILQNEIIVE